MEIILGIIVLGVMWLFEAGKSAGDSKRNEAERPLGNESQPQDTSPANGQTGNASESTKTINVEADRIKGLELDELLSAKQRAIRQLSDSRGITELLHFSRFENLESILRNGLLCRKNLDEGEAVSKVNDDIRLDGHRDSVSLSIAFPNYLMFYKYRQTTAARGWVVLSISPEVMWKFDCAFCSFNAADNRIRLNGKDQLQSLEALNDMFLEPPGQPGFRGKERLLPRDPTDPQAEVLVFANIPPSFIREVYVDDRSLHRVFQTRYPQLKSSLNSAYFSTRRYQR